MDPRDKSESRLHRREDPLARRIGQALDDLDSRNASDCPDGEILAAYAERGLAQEETAKWESHFATCARCRKILLVLNGSADSPLAEKEVARLLEHDQNARSDAEPLRTASPRAWHSLADWRVRWLAPALGVAAAVAVLLVMRSPGRSGNNAGQPTLIARAPTQQMTPSPAVPEADRLSRVAPREEQKSLALPQSSRSFAPGAAPLNSPAGALAKRRAGTDAAANIVSPSAGAIAGSTTADKKSSALQGALEGQPPSPPASASNAVAPQTTLPPQATPQAEGAAPPASVAQTVTVTEAAPRVETTNGTLGTARQAEARDLPVNGRNFESLARLKATPNGTILVQTPSEMNLWRAGRNGSIERSVDGGRTWNPQPSPLGEDWLAGAAVSATVCWLAGRNGALARTADGEHWEHIAPPLQSAAAAGKIPDWSGITALDAQSATVTATDGRRYVTRDGGMTWQIP